MVRTCGIFSSVSVLAGMIVHFDVAGFVSHHLLKPPASLSHVASILSVWFVFYKSVLLWYPVKNHPLMHKVMLII